MVVEVAPRLGQAIQRALSTSNVVGDGMLVRLRSATLGMLGLVTAVGLGLVALVAHQGWPGVFSGPLPQVPPRVVQNDPIAAPSPAVGFIAQREGETLETGASGRQAGAGFAPAPRGGIAVESPVEVGHPQVDAPSSGPPTQPQSPPPVTTPPPNEEAPPGDAGSSGPSTPVTAAPTDSSEPRDHGSKPHGHSDKSHGHSGDVPGRSDKSHGRSDSTDAQGNEAEPHDDSDYPSQPDDDGEESHGPRDRSQGRWGGSRGNSHGSRGRGH